MDGLSTGKSVAECSDRWFLCLVMAGRGHTPGLLSDLNASGATFYFPVVTAYRISRNGNTNPEKNCYKRKVQLPLFPGYLFLNGDNAKSVAYDSDHAYRVDEIANGMQGPLTEQLRAVEYKIGQDETFAVGPMFKAGTAVRILYPHELAGTLGRVSADGNDGTVWVNIPLLNAGIPLQIPFELVERVSNEVTKQRTLLVCCSDCGRDTRNPSGLCDRCNGTK